jgi:TolA-binding protein
MLQYEVTRKQLLDKQQQKIDAMEARAAELRGQKAEREKQWAAAQRERELQKVCSHGSGKNRGSSGEQSSAPFTHYCVDISSCQPSFSVVAVLYAQCQERGLTLE